MSNIILQFGQCGNQVGQALYECVYEDIMCKNEINTYLNNDYIQDSLNQWFHTKQNLLEARSILIDTEEKVTNLANKKKAYKFKNIISSSYGGSANNWAFGYVSQSLLVCHEVIEKIRQEVEKCDFVCSLVNILSSSGGTGSGVGSKVIEIMKDEFSSKFITNIVILPFQKGDVVTQNYNTLLTLAKLYDITDNTILFENDKAYEISKKLQSNKEIKLSDLNQIVAQQLASVMQPVKNQSFYKLISDISCHPSYRFVQIKTAPHLSIDHMKYEPVLSWSLLTNQVLKNSRSDVLLNNKFCKTVKYIGNSIITRGNTFGHNFNIKQYKESSIYVDWVPDSQKITHYEQQRQLLNYQKFISLITNNNSVCSILDSILEDAWNLFTHGAYLHHYGKYGINDQYFLEAFQKLENILNDYKLM